MATKLTVGELEFNVDAARIREKFPDTYLADLFRANPGQHQFFIDRDGELFKVILAYLRTQVGISLMAERTKCELCRIRDEAIFFGLGGLAENAQTYINNLVLIGAKKQIFIHIQLRDGEYHFRLPGCYIDKFIERCSVSNYQKTLCNNIDLVTDKNYFITMIQALPNAETIYVLRHEDRTKP